MDEELQALEDAFRDEINQLFAEVPDDERSGAAFAAALSELLAAYIFAAYYLGRGETEIEDAQRERIEEWITTQVAYAQGFGEVLESEGWSNRWPSRAESYVGALGMPYWMGKTWYLVLPAYPRDLSTICGQNCVCEWEIHHLGNGDWDCYWRLGVAEHCPDCLERSRLWNPLQVRDGVYKEFTLKERLSARFKHMAGRHNQKRHGWRGTGLDAVRRAMRSGISEDYAGQTTPEAEREAARAKFGLAPLVSKEKFEAAQKRIADGRDKYLKDIQDINAEYKAAQDKYTPLYEEHKKNMEGYYEVSKKAHEAYMRNSEYLEKKNKEIEDFGQQIDALEKKKWDIYDKITKLRNSPRGESIDQWDRRIAAREKLEKQFDAAGPKIEKMRAKLEEMRDEAGWYSWKKDFDKSKLHESFKAHRDAEDERSRYIEEHPYVKQWLEKEKSGNYSPPPGAAELSQAYTKMTKEKQSASERYVSENQRDADSSLRYLRSEAAKVRSTLGKKESAEYAQANKENDRNWNKLAEYVSKNKNENEKYYLEPEYKELHAKFSASRERLTGLEKNIKSNFSDLLKAKNPTRLQVESENGKDAQMDSERQDGFAAFKSLMPSNKLVEGAGKAFIKNIPEDKEQRAYQLGDSEVHLPISYTSKTTVVHEFGHLVESRDPLILRQSLAWRDKRTPGQKAIKMNEAEKLSSYDDDEITKPDNFIHSYIGKQYGRRATEVLSMGLQMFFQEPARLARVDPDMFDYIFATIRVGAIGEV